MNKIVIVVCGGIVTGVWSKENLEVVVMDKDNMEAEGMSDEDMELSISKETEGMNAEY